MVSHQPPVCMPDTDDDFSYSYSQPQSTDENSLESKMDVSVSKWNFMYSKASHLR